MPNRIVVSSADFIRNIGHWQNEAIRQPISITHHGRERLILAAPQAFGAAADNETTESSTLATLQGLGAALLENMEEGYLSFDGSLRFLTVNNVAEAFLGGSRDAVREKFLYDVISDPLASLLADRLQRVLRTRSAEVFESGEQGGRLIRVRVFPTPMGAAALFSNVTELTSLQRKHEDLTAMRSAVDRHACMAMIHLDGRGRIDGADEKFCDWTGFVANDLRGHRLADVVAVDTRRGFQTALERTLRDGVAVELEVTVVGRRGDEISGCMAIAPVRTDLVSRGACALWTRQSTGAHAA